MNLELSKDDFHELIITYIVQMTHEKADMIEEDTMFSTPIFDEFILFLDNKSLPSNIRHSYNKMTATNRMKYNRLKKHIQEARSIKVLI